MPAAPSSANNPVAMLRSTILPLLLVLSSGLLAATTSGKAWFHDATAELGVDFVHVDARTGEKFYPETAASGGGLVDVDHDGDLDLYLVNGAPQPGWRGERDLRNRLYENRDGRFVDVTAASGTGDTGYGMGVCAGDPNSDGLVDLMVTNFGPDRLLLNLGGGKFREAAAEAGVDDARWSASCAFGDLDGDGDHDLYVTHYVDFHYERNPFCGDRARNLRAYCRPSAFQGVTDSLFINRGDGTFVDLAKERGLRQGREEKGFGVVLWDLDADGDLDLYVANDGTENRLYQNDGRGSFEDVGLLGGVALNSVGRAESGMGIAIGDYDGDLQPDLFVTNYSMETNTLYRNQTATQRFLSFVDVSRKSGIAESSYPYVAWGARFFDADNDGDLDLAIVNGHAIDNIEVFEAGLQYAQPNQLLLNDGSGRFSDQSHLGGPAWQRPSVSRGLATGDVDDDGRLDLLVTNTNARPDLLLNRRTGASNWVRVELVDPQRLPIGAAVEIVAGERRQIATVQSGGSFLSQSDLRLHFGLGSWNGEVVATVRWPGGRTQIERTDLLNRTWTIRRTSER